jgi:hypothetical protein
VKGPILTMAERAVVLGDPPPLRGEVLAAVLRRAALRRAEAMERRPARPLPIRDAVHSI